MASTCKDLEQKVEDNVLQPVDQWSQQLQQQCEQQPCNWWTLCLNKLLCWMLWVLVKICIWLTVLIVRWLFVTVCTIVLDSILLLVGLLTLNMALIGKALSDVWSLMTDLFYTVLGAVIGVGAALIGFAQTVIRQQNSARKLTPVERRMLFKIFRDSLPYPLISVVDGKSGLFDLKTNAFTIGARIYMKNTSAGDYKKTLVHECVHVWPLSDCCTDPVRRLKTPQTAPPFFEMGLNH